VDESEKLIIQAALGNPNLAQKAWAKWKTEYPLSEASPILSWAAGYIYNNLKASGLTDVYLMGIYRHNLVANNLRLSAALPVLTALNERYGIIPLKSFSLSTQGFSWGNRPVADFDFYSKVSNTGSIWDFLHDKNYESLMGVSEKEFNSRILNFRGSWNFKNIENTDLDLHWRIFDHLGLKENRELVCKETIIRKTQIGFHKFLSPELDLVVIANHHFLQGENRFNGLFDIFHQAKSIDVNKVLKLVMETNTEISMQSTITMLSEIMGDENHPTLELIGKSIQKRKYPQDKTTIPNVSRYFKKSSLQAFELEHRHARIYKLWSLLGRHAFLEKFLLRQFGAFSKYVEMPKSAFNFASQKEYGVGWHYQYPIGDWRWGHTPDSRIAWRIQSEKIYRVTIEFNSHAWSVSPVGSVNVFFNGIFQQGWTKENSSLSCLFSTDLEFLEISFRPEKVIDYMAMGPHFNWYRFTIPIMNASVIELS
jgi:hypothetical protein